MSWTGLASREREPRLPEPRWSVKARVGTALNGRGDDTVRRYCHRGEQGVVALDRRCAIYLIITVRKSAERASPRALLGTVRPRRDRRSARHRACLRQVGLRSSTAQCLSDRDRCRAAPHGQHRAGVPDGVECGGRQLHARHRAAGARTRPRAGFTQHRAAKGDMEPRTSFALFQSGAAYGFPGFMGTPAAIGPVRTRSGRRGACTGDRPRVGAHHPQSTAVTAAAMNDADHAMNRAALPAGPRSNMGQQQTTRACSITSWARAPPALDRR